ncbi:MAG: S46 family peptidase, partial [Bacteroidetes bacterium]|nr:S46 family peptidase [Bacteroidota bacterium]
KKLEIWKKYMDQDRKTRIQYASKYAGTSNTWKYMIGQERGLKRLGVTAKKQDIEKEFQAWADGTPERKEKYGSVLNDYKTAYEAMGVDYEKFLYTVLCGSSGSEILGYSQSFGQLLELLKKDSPEAIIQETVDQLKASSGEHFKDYNEILDEEVMAGLFKLYYQKVPKDFVPALFQEMLDKHKGNFEAMAKWVFETSVFSTQDKVNTFLDKPKAKTIEKDPAYQLAGAFAEKMMEARGAFQQAQAGMSKYDRLFIDGLRKMNTDKVYYPDANSTMRLSYGSVLDYYPADAVYYNYYTTLEGVMEKEDPNNDEFIVEEKLKKLFAAKDYGRYGEMINGEKRMITCFLTTNDITGGNSGSPVINGNGELIGIAFDGNWEAMSGDIAFEPELQRTINVDIRYVLFIIDKFAGAKNLIDELTIVTEKIKPQEEIILKEPLEVHFENIYFENNVYNVPEKYLPVLQAIAEFLNENDSYSLIIASYTDDKGPAAYNKKISQKRGEETAKLLSKKYQIPEDRIIVKGLGEENFLQDNATDEGRDANRRIEFELVDHP